LVLRIQQTRDTKYKYEGEKKDVSEFLQLDVENFRGGSDTSDSSVTSEIFYVTP